VAFRNNGLFNNYEHGIVQEQRDVAMPHLEPYLAFLATWMPDVATRVLGQPRQGRDRFDAGLTWKGPRGTIRYLVEVKGHLQNQDVRVVIDQLERWKGQLPAADRAAKLLLLAPTVRPHQATVLERAGVDYADLAGNAHLAGPGLLVHVEGRRAAKEPLARRGRPNKGWVKAVLTLLVRPELVNRPYRDTAEQADVALGTVAACIQDLIARRLLLQVKGQREVVDRQQLVALWVQAYVDVLRPKLTERRFQVRAATKPEMWERLGEVLAKHHVRWALTGADAAERRTNYFHAEDTEIYAPIAAFEDREVLKRLVAQPAARGGNLLVIEPPAPTAAPDAAGQGPPTAPVLLTYAELRYRGTEQALEAAEILLPAATANTSAILSREGKR
jgi:hypothetical protein